MWWRDADATADGDETRILERLRAALSAKTKIVAACHVSNLFGGVLDVPAVVALARKLASPSCAVVLDSVAFAPHRALRVSDWGVDWCAFSPYKTFGPHCGCLFGSRRAFEAVRAFGPNHEFVDPKAHAYKFELGGVAHEVSAGLVGMGKYLRVLSGAARPEASTTKETFGSSYANLERDCVPSREGVLVAFERVASLERAAVEIGVGSGVAGKPRARSSVRPEDARLERPSADVRVRPGPLRSRNGETKNPERRRRGRDLPRRAAQGGDQERVHVRGAPVRGSRAGPE